MNTIQSTQSASTVRPGNRTEKAPAGEAATQLAARTGAEESTATDREQAAGMPAYDPEAAREYVHQVQEALQKLVPEPHSITFRQDEATHGFVIEVRNPDGSVVRQYPPEKLLNLRRKLDELSGMVIDEMT
ncbi:MAG: flagellar protein FlaG [bacterium]|nr:flagellar protein FlaG [bacterium]